MRHIFAKTAFAGLLLMGVTACQLLLKNINGDGKVYKKIVPQQLVIRETSAKRTVNKQELSTTE